MHFHLSLSVIQQTSEVFWSIKLGQNGPVLGQMVQFLAKMIHEHRSRARPLFAPLIEGIRIDLVSHMSIVSIPNRFASMVKKVVSIPKLKSCINISTTVLG